MDTGTDGAAWHEARGLRLEARAAPRCPHLSWKAQGISSPVPGVMAVACGSDLVKARQLITSAARTGLKNPRLKALPRRRGRAGQELTAASVEVSL